MELNIVPDTDFNAVFADRLLATLARHDRPVLGISVGSTTLKALGIAARQAVESGISLAGVQFVPLEIGIGLPVTHRFAFRNLVREALGDGTGVTDGAIHDFEDPAADGAVLRDRLAARLESLGGLSVALLGVGTNGHIAALEPAATQPAQCCVVELLPESREQLAADLQAFSHLVSAGMADLLLAPDVLIGAAGANKAQAMGSLAHQHYDPMVPLTFFVGHVGAVYVIDESAARFVTPPAA
jgi:glucosamine-6-phosphate deaminase